MQYVSCTHVNCSGPSSRHMTESAITCDKILHRGEKKNRQKLASVALCTQEKLKSEPA